jgi:hypothetical protein
MTAGPAPASERRPASPRDGDGHGDGHGRGDGDTDGRSASAAAHRRRRDPGIRLDCHAESGIRHVGIVFVHGIGTQEAGETLLDWGGAIIGALLDVRVGHQASADPVIDVQLDPGPGESRYIELQLPPVLIGGTPVPEQHWVMTEAWWAQRVRPPSFGQMAEWLGPRGSIRRIVMALLPNVAQHDPRLRPAVERHPLRRNAETGDPEEDVEHGPPVGHSRIPSEGIRQLWRSPASFYFQAVSALVLLLYGVLRSVEKLLPIGPLKDGALTRPIDTFMLDWFGDVYVLLGDPAQAASIRSRLVDALSDLAAVECQEVTVVAHSGGAMVSHMTLADDSTQDLQVDRLVTLGEALNLGWRLTAGEDGRRREDAEVQYERLYRSLMRRRPKLSWHDFWASKDPAPVGVLQIPRTADSSDPANREEGLDRIESHAVWNRLSLGDDHGSYWENDEEFLLPMLRLLENRPADTALFGDERDDEVRSNHRRRRLSILSLWRQTTMLAPLGAVLAAYLAGTGFLERAGDAVARLWSVVPGNEAITGPLNWVRGLALQDTFVGRFVAETGVWVIGAALAAATIYAVISPPERSIPWATARGWRRWIGTFLEVAPLAVGLLLLLALVAAIGRFLGGSTVEARDAGGVLVRVVGGVLAVVGIIWLVIGRPVGGQGDLRGWRSVAVDLFDFGSTIVVLSIAAILVAAPFVALAVFEQAGRLVLGIATVVVLFSVLGRIGAWRWRVWDARERVAARRRRPYPGVERVLLQVGLLAATLTALVIGVVANADPWLLAALGLGIATVLLGVSVDVVDAARLEQHRPSDAFMRGSRNLRA